MTKFDASKAVEPLEFDFKPYHEAKGTVPEPTDDQVAQFYGDLGQQFRKALGEERTEGLDMTDPMDVGKLFQSLDGDDHKAMYDVLLELHSAVCSNEPGREAVEKLPFRLRRAWYGMVQGWLRPEASRSATDN